MKVERINDSFSVSGQIAIEDMQTLFDLGVQVIVCNRPDGESSGQPAFQDIREAADRLYIATYLIDFLPNSLTDDKAQSFAKVVASNKKIHAYCQTGSRSKTIYKGI